MILTSSSKALWKTPSMIVMLQELALYSLLRIISMFISSRSFSDKQSWKKAAESRFYNVALYADNMHFLSIAIHQCVSNDLRFLLCKKEWYNSKKKKSSWFPPHPPTPSFLMRICRGQNQSVPQPESTSPERIRWEMLMKALIFSEVCGLGIREIF